MHYVYVLQSSKDHRTYVGCTKDLNRRLKQHNDGAVVSTKSRIPLKLLFLEEFYTLKEAMQRERWWKGSSGRKRLKVYFAEKV